MKNTTAINTAFQTTCTVVVSPSLRVWVRSPVLKDFPDMMLIISLYSSWLSNCPHSRPPPSPWVHLQEMWWGLEIHNKGNYKYHTTIKKKELIQLTNQQKLKTVKLALFLTNLKLLGFYLFLTSWRYQLRSSRVLAGPWSGGLIGVASVHGELAMPCTCPNNLCNKPCICPYLLV